MLPQEKALLLKKFGVELKLCGTQWGTHVDLSGFGSIKAYTGKESWIETAVKGVIGIHGNEPGNGPGILIQDVEHTNIDIIWTSGLIGCMALAIQGRDKNGLLDVFFCHARKYDEKDAINNPDNPMKLARDFIKTHDDIRVFWGTDFNFGVKDFSGPLKKSETQKLLSKELGCWVRNNDCVVSQELVFFPKLGIMKEGSPRKAYQWACSQQIALRSEFSKSMVLSLFIPDSMILKKLEKHLIQLQNDRSSAFRFYLYDSRRTNKINVLKQVLDAYKVGNFDVLRHFARAAEKKLSPFVDPDAVNTWSARKESLTAKLVLETYLDTREKILAMGQNGCGLRADGNDISSYSEYGTILEEHTTFKKRHQN